MGEVVVGVMYPAEWYGDADGFAREIDALNAIEGVEAFAETYVESHELRTLRGQPDADAARSRVPELTDAQRDAFARSHVVIAIDLPFDVAQHAPNLRWVQSVGAGTAQLQSAGLAEAGITLTSSAGANAVGIAEFVMARILQHFKHLRRLDDSQTRHEWAPVFGRQIAGCTLGLLGLGAINSAVAARAQAFGMRVLATRRSATPGATEPGIDELFPTSELHTMLRQCDVVVAAVPETAETRGMIGAAELAAMPTDALFCNVGRGSLVDEAALIAALESGQLGAAALDVASQEPLPPVDPLWSAPNLYLSPHTSASPAALFVNLHQLFRENLERFLAGEPLRNEVDMTRGY